MCTGFDDMICHTLGTSVALLGTSELYFAINRSLFSSLSSELNSHVRDIHE